EAVDQAPGSRLGAFPPPTPGAPDPGVECLVVQLDHLEELGVVRVSLGEPPRDHRVMVLALSGPASVDAVLERVVDEGDEAQALAVLGADRHPVDVGENLGDVGRHGTTWRTAPRTHSPRALMPLT